LGKIIVNMSFKSLSLGFLAGPFAALIAASANSYLVTLLIPMVLANLSAGMNWITAYLTVSSFLIHAGFALLGGYTAGRFAQKNEYWHAGVIVILGVLANIGLSFFITHQINAPALQLTYSMRLLLTTMPYAMVGAHLARVKNMKEIASN